jgi:hypothetical protein
MHWPAYEGWMTTDYPSIIADQTVLMALVVFMGAIGGGTYDYIGYLSLYREKRWGALGLESWGASDLAPKPTAPQIETIPANLATGRQWLRGAVVDVFVGFFCVLVFSIAFYLLGAAILHPRHLVPHEFALLTPQVEFLTQFGRPFKYLYQAGILMAFWGTIYGAFEIYSRTAYESFRPLMARVRRTPFARLRLPVCLYAGLGGLALMWTVQDPLKIVQPAALVGTTTCGLWCFAMIWADAAVLPRGLRMSRSWVVLNVLAGMVLTGFGCAAIWDAISG